VGWIAGDSSLLILLTFLRIIPAVEDDIPLSRVIPEDCESFGGLVRVSLARNYAAFASQNGGPSEGSVCGNWLPRRRASILKSLAPRPAFQMTWTFIEPCRFSLLVPMETIPGGWLSFPMPNCRPEIDRIWLEFEPGMIRRG
jgi:hypothetical protein